MAINKIKTYREQKKPYMSQWKLANKIDVTQAMISIWEQGYKEPTAKQKVWIAKALNSTVKYLFPKEKEEF